jgi:hypothetical protein
LCDVAQRHPAWASATLTTAAASNITNATRRLPRASRLEHRLEQMRRERSRIALPSQGRPVTVGLAKSGTIPAAGRRFCPGTRSRRIGCLRRPLDSGTRDFEVAARSSRWQHLSSKPSRSATSHEVRGVQPIHAEAVVCKEALDPAWRVRLAASLKHREMNLTKHCSTLLQGANHSVKNFFFESFDVDLDDLRLRETQVVTTYYRHGSRRTSTSISTDEAIGHRVGREVQLQRRCPVSQGHAMHGYVRKCEFIKRIARLTGWLEGLHAAVMPDPVREHPAVEAHVGPDIPDHITRANGICQRGAQGLLVAATLKSPHRTGDSEPSGHGPHTGMRNDPSHESRVADRAGSWRADEARDGRRARSCCWPRSSSFDGRNH